MNRQAQRAALVVALVLTFASPILPQSPGWPARPYSRTSLLEAMQGLLPEFLTQLWRGEGQPPLLHRSGAPAITSTISPKSGEVSCSGSCGGVAVPDKSCDKGQSCWLHCDTMSFTCTGGILNE